MAEHRRRDHGNPDAHRLPQVLHGHIQRRFPDRLDEATTERVVAQVMACVHRIPAWDAKGELSPALKAKINWAVLDVLWPNRGRSESAQEYDDLFAQAIFGDFFDAEAINRGMRTLVDRDQVNEVLILTQYLDMAYLNGAVPTAGDVIDRLRSAGRRLTGHYDVRDVVLDFYRLLSQQQVVSR